MNIFFKHARSLLLFVSLTCLAERTQAQNVDLVTLPARETVQLTIYNSEDITLARETRQITLKKGHNRLQFSWAGTLIDPTSVELRPLAHTDEIEVVDTVFPGQKPLHLFWNIESEFEGQVPVEVSYFTSGLTWQMDYVAISDPEETKLDFRGFVRVFNNSGEQYENAQIRLIVGKINLVEKIAQLAQQSGIPHPVTKSAQEGMLKQLATRRSFDKAAEAAKMPAATAAPKEIVKEGLSEYFMFGVQGEETIPNGWSKRMRAIKADAVKFDIVYRIRSYQYGPRPIRFFIWRNDAEHGLGESPLPNGLVRLFRENGRDGLGYLGQQTLEYVPVAAPIEINLGADDLVVHEWRKNKSERFNFAFHPNNSHVVGWDESQRLTNTVRNYRDKPIRVELRLLIDGDIEMSTDQETTSFDYRTVEMKFEVAPRDKTERSYSTVQHHGTNKKQNRLRLKLPQ